METVATQFGTALGADFEENTWTFEMPEDFKVWAGKFAIIDKSVYDELLQALKMCIELFDKNEPNWYLLKHDRQIKDVIKKATE